MFVHLKQLTGILPLICICSLEEDKADVSKQSDKLQQKIVNRSINTDQIVISGDFNGRVCNRPISNCILPDVMPTTDISSLCQPGISHRAVRYIHHKTWREPGELTVSQSGTSSPLIRPQ